MRTDARLPILIVAVLLASSCRSDAPVPPPESSPAPPLSLRPLTSRERPAPSEATGLSAEPGTLPPGHPPLASGPPARPAAAGESVGGTVVVAPALRARAASGVLFVIARAGADRRIVAVRREDAVSFPFAFRISGADAMMEGTAFAGPLEITARLSRSGDAVAAKGDLEGVARGVAVGAKDVRITLDTVHE